MDGQQEVGFSILDELAQTYGKRIGFGTVGFGGGRADLLKRYQNQVIGGFSEKPKNNNHNPVEEEIMKLCGCMRGGTTPIV